MVETNVIGKITCTLNTSDAIEVCVHAGHFPYLAIELPHGETSGEDPIRRIIMMKAETIKNLIIYLHLALEEIE